MTDQPTRTPEDHARILDAYDRYNRACHAMQSGVAMDQERKPESLKHLRVGINSAMVTDLAMARLLIDKGIITEVEYHEAVAQAMEDEVERYKQILRDSLGIEVNLL